MKIRTFNTISECQSPKLSKDTPTKTQIAKGLFMAGALSLAIGCFVPEEPTTYWFNGPEMDNAVLEDNTYNITFEDGTYANVTKDMLAQEDLSYFGYNSYPLNGHQCSVTPRKEVGFKDLFLCSGSALLFGGILVTIDSLHDKRKNKKREEKEKRKQYAKQRATRMLYKKTEI